MVNDKQTYAIIGAAMEVHSELGNGFLENVYHRALEQELKICGIKYQTEVKLPVIYKGIELDCYYISDLICFYEVIVELKAVDTISSEHISQTLNYLKASGLNRALF